MNEKMKKKKKIGAEPFLGYCPNYIVKKKIFVLQPWFCIARERAGKKIVVKIVLQYNFCIVEKKA